jgi:phenylacetate-coenzyme A ligase PaaK-like adenylate-forming protein
MGYAEYIAGFDSLVAKYIPDRSAWTPSDKALYGNLDPYRVPLKEADGIRLEAIRYQFKRHYELNRTYHHFCKDAGVTPGDIKSTEDLKRIPLVPSEFFKDSPEGRDFAIWLANVYTGDVPSVRISGKDPTRDAVVKAFNDAGMAVCYSSGTGGRHTFTPRDQAAFNANEYAMAKGVVAMMYPYWNSKLRSYLLLPNPFKTSLFAGKLATIFYDITEDVTCAIDREINTELIRLTMTDDKSIKGRVVRGIASRGERKAVEDIIAFIDKVDKKKEQIGFVGSPYLLHCVIKKLKEDGRGFDFHERGAVLTGGGWKVHENERIPEAQFRKDLEDVLGITPERVIDLYGMVEGNVWLTQCPEGHHLHIPYCYAYPMVLGEDFEPLGYGEIGRFAFLDGTMGAYPGFIITGDKVRMHERCPVCGRPGPVLEPGVTRAVGQGSRGCGEEVRKVISADLGG